MLIAIAKGENADQPLVAGTPNTVVRLRKLGYEVCVETGAGLGANCKDENYADAGATIVDAPTAWGADVVLCVDAPSDERIALLRPGAVLVSRLDPDGHPERVRLLAERGVTALAVDMVPRISRAQSLDVRSSMQNIAGYRAVIEAAANFGRLFTGQVTAAGKMPPAKVYVIGVGVAGLAAIGTAVSMGAVVSATDVRPEVAEQVESLGAAFVEIPVQQESSDGYARALDDDEQARVLEVYTREAAANDIVITTAQIPGRPSPLLLTAEAVESMRPGSVIVDLGASEAGSNCALTVPGQVVCTPGGVTIVGHSLTMLPAFLPRQASQLFGQNLVNLFKLCTPAKDGVLVLNEDDEVVRSMTVTLEGAIMWPPPPVSVSAKPVSAKDDEQLETEKEANAKAASDSAPDRSEAVRGKTAHADSSRHPERSAEGAKSKDVVTPKRGLGWKIALGVAAALLIAVAPASMQSHFMVFALAVVVGFYVITGVSHSLHTPLMSVTNAISGIIVVGALLQMGTGDPLVTALAFVALVLGAINIFGGFLVTRRMLRMFERSSE